MDPLNNETVVERHSLRTRICLVGSVAEDHEIQEAAQLFKVPVESSSTGEEFISDDSWTTYFILSDFEGQIFEKINKAKTKHRWIFRIASLLSLLLTTASLEFLVHQHCWPHQRLPMDCLCITDQFITTVWKTLWLHSLEFVNEMNWWELNEWTSSLAIDYKLNNYLQTQLVHLIHFMGGSIRKEMNHRATHLICSNAYGDKYRYALTFRLNVVRSSWVMNAWMKRDEAGFFAKDESFTADHRLKIFEGCRVAFIGFPEHERLNMVDLLRSYNGVETSRDDETCTHKVSVGFDVKRWI